MKEKIAWKNVLQKAEGEKIKDDPILLKKSIKKLVRHLETWQNSRPQMDP